MADLGQSLKNIWMKGMEAIGNTASNIANNTRFKVDEMNMLNRRREILSDFGAKAYALWQKGEKDIFPEELQEQLRELSALDEKLNDLRAERYASGLVQEETEQLEEPEEPEEPEESEEPEEPEEPAEADEPEEPEKAGEAEEAAETDAECEAEKPEEENTEETAEPEGPETIPVLQMPEPEEAQPKSSSLSSAIDELFEKAPSVEEMAEKVNSSLDRMGENLKKFSDEMDQHLDDLTSRLTKGPEDGPKE